MNNNEMTALAVAFIHMALQWPWPWAMLYIQTFVQKNLEGFYLYFQELAHSE